ncbi:restriction endonuclease subunit S [Nostoc sp.]|uniref:restriction endonuclease subunit S n=1 Tax=Nostoc sp. TaxID=1180 RepID=UPI002FF54A8B
MCEVLVKTEEFKDSPLGKIPKDWEVSLIENKLQQIIDYRGKTPDKTNSGIPLITAKNVRNGYLDPEPREYIDEKNYDIWMRRGLPKAEDILFTTEAPLGNVARVPSYKIALAQRLLTLRASPEELDAGYLFWLLNWSESRQRLEQKSTGSTVLGIKQSVFRKIFFRFPPLPEQPRIAEILDTVDEAIARTSSLIIKLKQTKAGLLQDLLTRGLDNDGKLRDPQAHPEQFKDSPLGRIPKNWEVRLLATVAEVNSGVTLGRNISGVGTIELPYLRVANVQDGYLELNDIKTIRVYKEEVIRFLLQPGDVLMNEGGDYDKLGRGTVWNGQIVPCLHQNHVFRVRPNEDYLISDFLALVSGSAYGKRFFILSSKQSTNLASINSTQLKSFPIPCPTILEQQRIMSVFKLHETRIRAEEVYLNKLKLQKQGLMQDLLTGKVRVKNL